MTPDGDGAYDYEVGFTLSPDDRYGQVRLIEPARIFYGNVQEDVVLRVKAESDDDAAEKAFALLTDPAGPYVKKYGPGFEVKKKFVWRVIY